MIKNLINLIFKEYSSVLGSQMRIWVGRLLLLISLGGRRRSAEHLRSISRGGRRLDVVGQRWMENSPWLPHPRPPTIDPAEFPVTSTLELGPQWRQTGTRSQRPRIRGGGFAHLLLRMRDRGYGQERRASPPGCGGGPPAAWASSPSPPLRYKGTSLPDIWGKM